MSEHKLQEAIKRMQALGQYLAEEQEKAKAKAIEQRLEAAAAHHDDRLGKAAVKRELAAKAEARAEAMAEIGKWLGTDLVILGSHRLGEHEVTNERG